MGRWRGLDCSKEKKRRVREELFRKQKGLCYLCNELMILTHHPSRIRREDRGNVCTFEHIIPRSEGGRLGLSNIALSHRRCNNKRASNKVRIDLKRRNSCIEYEFINDTEIKATYTFYKDGRYQFERYLGNALGFLIWVKYRDL